MRIVGDGDSSVFARIQEELPVWGKHVQKIECADHVCKCLRTHLENLVVENPSYTGKGNLTKQTRIRIVSAVRCSIRRRSAITDRRTAVKLLQDDIRNCINHIYGKHNHCSSDFCKVKITQQQKSEVPHCAPSTEDNNPNCEDLLTDQAAYWDEGLSIDAQEEARGDSQLRPSDLPTDLLRDITLILERVASKSDRLIGNSTTNLAECWMHIRCKFDGGKVYNHCNRFSWHTRCYAGALRFNLGPTWSTQVWEQSTETRAGKFFSGLYERRDRNVHTNTRSKKQPQSLAKRWKRKMASLKQSTSKKSRMDYGPDAIDVSPDVSAEQLQTDMNLFVNFLLW